MTNQHPATVADSLSVHGDINDGEFDTIVDRWSKLDSRLRSFDAGTVLIQLFVKERDTKSQHVTLDVKIDGHSPLVATSSSADLDHALIGTVAPAGAADSIRSARSEGTGCRPSGSARGDRPWRC